MKSKQLPIIILLVLSAAINIYFIIIKNGSEKSILDTLDITQPEITNFTLENIGELATQSGYYTGVDIIDDNRTINLFGQETIIPGTNSKIVFSYDGIIKAGLDFSEIKCEVNNISKKITIKMPTAKIISNEIDNDSCKIYDEKHSVFTLIRLERFNEAQADLKKEAEQNALEKGILTEAENNAKILITGFLSASYDLNEYEIVFIR